MKSVLILDDDDIVRKSLVYYFEDTEWQPIEAESGDEALRIIANEAPDAAVVDQRLPGMDGDTFIRHALELTRSTAFVICSGSIEYELPLELKATGCVSENIFVKPMANLEPLEIELNHILEKLRNQDSPTR